MREVLAFEESAGAGDEIELEVGDLLFGDVEDRGGAFVRQAFHDQQFDAFELQPIAALLPLLDLIANCVNDGVVFDLLALAAASNAAGGAG
ncbi:MAG: hypothetical protein ABL888_19430 [Pirellulaceae bacterium]